MYHPKHKILLRKLLLPKFSFRVKCAQNQRELKKNFIYHVSAFEISIGLNEH